MTRQAPEKGRVSTRSFDKENRESRDECSLLRDAQETDPNLADKLLTLSCMVDEYTGKMRFMGLMPRMQPRCLDPSCLFQSIQTEQERKETRGEAFFGDNLGEGNCESNIAAR